MAPVFIKMASKYQMAVFIEINIETCEVGDSLYL